MWRFATVNNRLAEIYFDRGKNGTFRIMGHCYVKKSEFKTAQEQKCIAEEARWNLTYKNKTYKMIVSSRPRNFKLVLRSGQIIAAPVSRY